MGNEVKREEFQFHTGSIKSENWAGLGTFLWGFQFHTGSIKSPQYQTDSDR